MELPIHYAAALAVLISTLAAYVVSRPKSVVAQIAGPPSPSWIFGHLRQLILSAQYGDYEFVWLKSYGLIYRICGCFGQERLMVADPVALQYLLNSPTFARAPVLDGLATLMFGRKSLLASKGDHHRRLRAGLGIGFTAAAVRKYLPIFKNAARIIFERFDDATDGPTNVCPFIGAGTLAAISEAVLGSSLEDLGEDFLENNERLVELSATQTEAQLLADAIAGKFPSWIWDALVYLPTTAAKVVRREQYLADCIGRRIVGGKMDAIAKGLEINDDVYTQLLNPVTSDHTRKLSEADVIAQTAVVVVGGQESTANTMAFALLELAKHPDFQAKLRAEIHSMPADGAGNFYDNMPYLNALIKAELYPALALSDRIALEDTVIPLSEAVATSSGELIHQIPVNKGQTVTMAIASYQRIASRWGDDADKFNPSRWLDGTTYQGEALGPYANLLSFNGGPRICLGWRFAILEMQVILCELVGKFSFAEVENEVIRVKQMSILLPIAVNSERAIPLRITRVL